MAFMSKSSTEPAASPSPSPAAVPSKPGNGAPSIISPILKITGDLNSSGDIHIDGEVAGDITSGGLTISQSGKSKGTIKSNFVQIHGQHDGDIDAKSIKLTATAKVLGNISYEELTVETGAFIEGALNSKAAPATNNVAPLRKPANGEDTAAQTTH